LNNVFFHVGYPKSASTTLQKQLFNKHTELVNLGLYPTKNEGVDKETNPETSFYFMDPLVKLFYDNLLKLDTVRYQQTDNFDLYTSLINKYAAQNKSVVFSEERATSVFFTHCDMGLKAQRIHELMPDGKIIIVIRNQSDALKSMYADFPFDPRSPSSGDSMDINAWLEVVLTDEFLFYREMLDYYSVIKFYKELFGKNNVCVLLFEELVSDKKSFANKISAFMGISSDETYTLLSEKHENSRVSHRYNILRSIKRKYLKNIKLGQIFGVNNIKKIESFLKQGRSRKYDFDDLHQQNVVDFYAKSNSNICNEYGLDFEMYNNPSKRSR
jgi:hypothetical protein